MECQLCQSAPMTTDNVRSHIFGWQHRKKTTTQRVLWYCHLCGEDVVHLLRHMMSRQHRERDRWKIARYYNVGLEEAAHMSVDMYAKLIDQCVEYFIRSSADTFIVNNFK